MESNKSDLTCADQRVSVHPKAEYYAFYKVSRISSFLGKIAIFLYTCKIILVVDFGNWHILKPLHCEFNCIF